MADHPRHSGHVRQPLLGRHRVDAALAREPSNHKYVVGSRGGRMADPRDACLQVRQSLLGRHRVDVLSVREAAAMQR